MHDTHHKIFYVAFLVATTTGYDVATIQNLKIPQSIDSIVI